MQGDPEIIELLNEILTAELTAINQYFIHAKMRSNWGFDRLAAVARKESIEEMMHAEKLLHRILFFDGAPNMSQLFNLRIGQNVKEQIEFDLALEARELFVLGLDDAFQLIVEDVEGLDLLHRQHLLGFRRPEDHRDEEDADADADA